MRGCGSQKLTNAPVSCTASDYKCQRHFSDVTLWAADRVRHTMVTRPRAPRVDPYVLGRGVLVV